MYSRPNVFIQRQSMNPVAKLGGSSKVSKLAKYMKKIHIVDCDFVQKLENLTSIYTIISSENNNIWD